MRSVALLFLVLIATLGAAWGQTETVLYSFCAETGCADGKFPVAGVIFDKNGNLYGTTSSGGAYGQGAIFEITPDGSETVLYSFCPINCIGDGSGPQAPLVFDQKGDLYGTTVNGGVKGVGVIFKLDPGGNETVLYNFCMRQKENICTDGAGPYAGLVLDNNGNLYGTTTYGGASGVSGCSAGCGVVFKVTPKGKETVLHAFCLRNGCADGAFPYAGLTLDQNGNLYGTTDQGGHKGRGTVFKVTPSGKEFVLYSFCRQTNCTDGAGPAGVVLDRKGNLYGTTEDGGTNGGGTAFEVTPKGNETVLYNFCAQGSNCTDGLSPYAGVILDPKGNLYGTTYAGGDYAEGTIFKITPKRRETVLYSFCQNSPCLDGQNPLAGLILDSEGNLYGTTPSGGSAGSGVVFEFTP
jgi:uncharacterized repeat protein (TIGR03803 family)